MIQKIKKFKKFVGDRTWKMFWTATIVGFLWFLVEASFVFVFQGFLRSIKLLEESQVFLPPWFPTSLSASLTILIFFGVFRALVFMLKNYFATNAQIAFSCNQRSQLLSYGIKEAGHVSSKEIITAFTELVTQSGVVVYYISQLINTSIAAILFFAMGFRLASYEMVLGVTILALFLLPLRILAKNINIIGEKIVKDWEKLNESLLRGLKNNFLLKIYNQFEPEIAKGDKNLKNYETNYMNYTLIAGVTSSFPLFAGVLILSFIAYLSIHYFHTLPMKLVSFFYIFIRLAQAASEGNSTIASLRMNWPGFRILYEWSLRAEEKTKSKKIKKRVLLGSDEIVIKLDKVSYNYEGQRSLFQNLNFEIARGDVFVIRGESGVGKSTLLSLVLGINEPTSGEVLINNYNTSQVELDLHKFLAYVGPEPYLIEGSVRENLVYGLDLTTSVNDQELYEALAIMELKDIIWNLPNKLDEFIYEIPQLSTGQKQRLAFARALVRKPALLILDEATANLDSDTESKIIGNLRGYFQKCTTIIVTHKSSFDAVSTEQITLQKGR